MTRRRMHCCVMTMAVAGLITSGRLEAAGAPEVEYCPRVLLVAGGPAREYRFLRDVLVREAAAKRMQLAIYLQTRAEGRDIVQGIPPDQILSDFPPRYAKSKKNNSNRLPDDWYLDLGRYDIVVAIDPDWEQIDDQARSNLNQWVDNGGGFIFVAGSMHTWLLARPGTIQVKLQPVNELLPVVLADARLDYLNQEPDSACALRWQPRDIAPEMEFLNISPNREPGHIGAGWSEFFYGPAQASNYQPIRGMFDVYPVRNHKKGAKVLAICPDVHSVDGEPCERAAGSSVPYMAMANFGAGKSFWIGSSETWRLRQFREDCHARFWIQLCRFMVGRQPAQIDDLEYRGQADQAQLQAVARGLEWLAKQQQKDGHWGDQARASSTAMAATAFLMEGSTLREGKYAKQLLKASDWLVNLKRWGTTGLFCDSDDMVDYMHGHALAMTFLAQAFGEEDDWLRRERFEKMLWIAIDFLEMAQGETGGWGPIACCDPDGTGKLSRDIKRDRATGVFSTVLQLHALRLAQNAGVAVPKDVIDKARKYLEAEMSPEWAGAALALALGADDYGSRLGQKWLKLAGDSGPACSTGKSLRDQYRCLGFAELAYTLGDKGYGNLFPKSKVEDRITWTAYRQKAVPTILESQNKDGSWGQGDQKLSTTAIFLAILQLDSGLLPSCR